VTGYKPTQEHPLAPPAPPAAGSENAPQGELTLAASLKGSDGKAAPITEGITVHVGDALNVQITLVNNSSEKKVIVFASSQKLDIEASNAAGKQVYRWSAGERFPQVVNSLELEAGTSWSHEVTIKIGAGENQLRPGKYNFAIMVTGTPQMALMAKNVTIAKD
jgi:uncharacterized membrane protein